MTIKVGVMESGKSIIYTQCDQGLAVNDVMFIEPVRDEKTKTVRLNFFPVAAYANFEESQALDRSIFFLEYTPEADVVRIYKLFLTEFEANRKAMNEARENSKDIKKKAEVTNINGKSNANNANSNTDQEVSS